MHTLTITDKTPSIFFHQVLSLFMSIFILYMQIKEMDGKEEGDVV